METQLGRIPAQTELPDPLKFASPIVVLPELFTTARHLASLVGYLSSIGWEVVAPDLYAVIGKDGTPPLEKINFDALVDLASEAVGAIGRAAIVIGHGLGGLVALKLAERASVKAAVAIGPLAPGFRSRLFWNLGNRIRMWQGRALAPPSRRMLFEFVADADVHARAQIIKSLREGMTTAIQDVVKGHFEFTAPDKCASRLIVAGESDIFAPYDRVDAFALRIGAPIAKIRGYGHWLIGGGALERTSHETQRFLVRSLGRELLLLFPEEWKSEE